MYAIRGGAIRVYSLTRGILALYVAFNGLHDGLCNLCLDHVARIQMRDQCQSVMHIEPKAEGVYAQGSKGASIAINFI